MMELHVGQADVQLLAHALEGVLHVLVLCLVVGEVRGPAFDLVELDHHLVALGLDGAFDDLGQSCAVDVVDQESQERYGQPSLVGLLGLDGEGLEGDVQLLAHELVYGLDGGAVVGPVLDFLKQGVLLLVVDWFILLLHHDLVDGFSNGAELLRLVHTGLVAEVLVDEHSEVANRLLKLPVGQFWDPVQGAGAGCVACKLFILPGVRQKVLLLDGFC